jgi:hypothetical protein
MPPSPEHVGDLILEKMVKPKIIPKKYVKTVDIFYDLYKQITHHKISELSGEEFDRLYKEAEEYISVMRDFINKKGYSLNNV